MDFVQVSDKIETKSVSQCDANVAKNKRVNIFIECHTIWIEMNRRCVCVHRGVDAKQNEKIKRKLYRLKCKQWSSGWTLCLLTFIQIIFQIFAVLITFAQTHRHVRLNEEHHLWNKKDCRTTVATFAVQVHRYKAHK